MNSLTVLEEEDANSIVEPFDASAKNPIKSNEPPVAVSAPAAGGSSSKGGSGTTEADGDEDASSSSLASLLNNPSFMLFLKVAAIILFGYICIQLFWSII